MLMVLLILTAMIVFTGTSLLSHQSHAQAASVVSVGAGSYTTTAPTNLTLPPNTIYRTSNVTGPMPTSDWWTSVAWTQPAYPIYPLPLALQTGTNGLGVSYPDTTTVSVAMHAGYSGDFTLGTTTLSLIHI